jgi:diguanylate cyclase (GGDEF)-like protein
MGTISGMSRGPDPEGGTATGPRQQVLIERMLRRRGLRLRFPDALEADYRQFRDGNAAGLFRASVVYIAVVYAGMGALAVLIIGPSRLGIWPLTFSSFGLLLLVGWLLSYAGAFHRFYQRSTSLLAGLAVAVAVAHPALIANDDMRVLIHIGTVYVMVVVYLALNLRVSYAMLAGWLGGGVSLLMQNLAGVSLEWDMLTPTYLGSSVLGMVLCYRDERGSRRLFLQARLLQQEKGHIQRLADRLEKLSLVDSLTGLANRRYFDQAFAREWRRCRRELRPMTLMFVDVDYFKAYNDFYGHQRGDDCLRDLAQVIAEHCSRAGDLAARYGGEEFVLLYPGIDRDEARELARQIMGAVHERAIPHARSEVANIVTVSIGVSVMAPGQESDRELLLRTADEALYTAKQGGRDRFEMA